MIKRFLLISLLFVSFFSIGNNGFADEAAEAKAAKLKHEQDCAAGSENKEKAGNCIDQDSFTISVNDISPGIKVNPKFTVEQTINNTLGTIIQKLMIALGSLSLLIMTIGAGYMILYHGQDELLSKGKSIFTSGIVALVVALSSYYIVALLRFILYQEN